MARNMTTKEGTRDADHIAAIDRVEEYLDATEDARRMSEKARDYKDGYQLTTAERNALLRRNQQPIINNRIKPKVQFLIGMEQRTRTRPKAAPRRPDAEDTAQASTDALNFIQDNNRSETEYSRGFEYFLVEGTEGHDVSVKANGNEFEIKHRAIPWDRLFWDPHSRRADFEDATYLGMKQWMDLDVGKQKFPDADYSVWSIGDEVFRDDNTMQDRPNYFTDAKRQRVSVFFCYFLRNGVWHYEIFTKGGFIQRPIPSPYLDDEGQPEPQFVFQSAFVDIEGNRKGEVESYLDMQDEINKRRSKYMWLLSARQTWAKKGAVKDVSKFKKEMSKPDGHLELDFEKFGEDFGILQTSDMAAGQAQLLQEAKQEIDAVGANAALQGTDERLLSGRALRSMQQGGSVELGPLFEGHRVCKNRVHRMMWNRVKQYKTDEWWVRVTDDEGKMKFTRINGQIRLGELIKQKAEEGGIQALSPVEQDMVMTNDPRLNNVVEVENPIRDMDVDIVMDEMQDFVTIQQEQFEVLARLYEANPQAVPYSLIVKASQLRNKDQLIEMIEGGNEQQKAALAEARQKLEQEAAEIKKAAALADIRETEASAMDKQASAMKKQAETKETMVDTAISIEQATQADMGAVPI